VPRPGVVRAPAVLPRAPVRVRRRPVARSEAGRSREDRPSVVFAARVCQRGDTGAEVPTILDGMASWFPA